jgi:hypothetical protein
MNIIHKSSSLTTITKYLITPLITAIFLYIVFLLATEQSVGNDFDISELPIMAWLVIVTIISSWYYKTVEAGDEYLIIKGFQSGDIVPYQNIKWISQSYMGRPMLYIRYKTELGTLKTAVTVPKMYTKSQFSKVLFNPAQELEMTSYIREQLKKYQPSYNPDIEPSRWLFFWIIMLSGVPFLVLSIMLLK